MPQTLDLPDAVQFIDANTLAKCLGKSRATILRWRRAGRLPRAAYATPTNTLWNAEDIAAWDKAGQPINAVIAMDAGPEKCADADRSGFDEQKRQLELHDQDFEADLSDRPEFLQEMIRQSQRHLMICESILNTCSMFIKTLDADELIAERREQICRDGSDTADEEKA